jgi:hypothetical protein
LAEEYLRRSANYPLSINFYYTRNNDLAQLLSDAEFLNVEYGIAYPNIEKASRNVGEASKDVFGTLFTRSPQWKAAKFDISAYNYPEMRAIMGHLPILAKFQHCTLGGDSHTSFHDTETFRSCPRLVDLTLATTLRLFAQYIDFQLTRYSGSLHIMMAP